MASLTKRAVREDVSLQRPSDALWKFQKGKPEIKQIYGHYLPPHHMKLVKGLVAKDFNFPAPYHATVDLSKLNELYAVGEKLTPESVVSMSGSIKMREEKDGAIVYTSYFNGFYMNRSAYEILKCCKDKVPINSIASKLGYDIRTIMEFLARALMLGLVDVCS
jgi:hypothetical protein